MPEEQTEGQDTSSSRELNEALGSLTVAFSNLEGALAIGVWMMVDQDGTEKGPAITAGRRLLDLADLYFSLAKMTAPALAEEFDKMRSRIVSVNDRRNRYVHSIWGVTPSEGKNVRFRFTVRGRKGLSWDVELAKPADIRQLVGDAVELVTEIRTMTLRHLAPTTNR